METWAEEQEKEEKRIQEEENQGERKRGKTKFFFFSFLEGEMEKEKKGKWIGAKNKQRAGSRADQNSLKVKRFFGISLSFFFIFFLSFFEEPRVTTQSESRKQI